MVVTKSGFFTGQVQPAPVTPRRPKSTAANRCWKGLPESGDSYRMEKALLLRHSAGLRKIIVHLVMAVTVAREFAR